MALFSMFTYWRAAQTENTNATGSRAWQLLGRNSFVLHSAAVAGIFITLFYIIQNHYFEYHYAWRHSDLSLSPKYLLSCFWEGQEGSFLLWTIWHCVLGLVVMFTSKGLETRAMSIIAMVQVALASMLLGFYLGPDIKIGSDPFILLRTQMQGAPIFSQPNYLELIKDGNGLNILLQNYWMVIHPPILFLGFASTLIPFAFTIAALWKGDYKEWIKPTLIWSLFCGGVLATGIMMGGAWAYESLTFGGYWAWDPVENASLVPWLVLVAGLHTLVIFKATGRSLIMTLVLLMFSYLLVWYSTFLTRTGVLGDTSVHAFTDEGKALYWHLIIVLGALMLLCISLLIKRWKGLPRIKSEEAINSREFWMFIGGFILLLSAIQIIITTSIPVWAPLAKYISGKDVAPPTDVVKHYNDIQVWVAFIILMLTSTILYLRFKTSDTKIVLKRLLTTFIIALIISVIIGYLQKIVTPQYALMLFAACYTMVGMIYYAIKVQNLVFKKMGASMAHFGFGTLMLGILISSYNKEVMSINTMGVMMDFGKKTGAENAKESAENVLLYKDVPVVMGEYIATFRGDSSSAADPRIFYKVAYERKDTTTNKVTESFTLYPDAFINPKGQQAGSMSPNPSSKHYLTRDIFTYVTKAYDPSKKTDTSSYKSHTVTEGDTIYTDKGYIIYAGLNTNVDDKRYTPQPGDIAVAATLHVYDAQKQLGTLKPIYYIRDQYAYQVQDTLASQSLYVKLENIIPDKKAIEIKLKQANTSDDYIVLKALIFPYINLVWLGVIIMVFGFFLTAVNRITKKEGKKKEHQA
jgi:cytochrome c-type biogenesis protein CcmF